METLTVTGLFDDNNCDFSAYFLHFRCFCWIFAGKSSIIYRKKGSSEIWSDVFIDDYYIRESDTTVIVYEYDNTPDKVNNLTAKRLITLLAKGY